jgi:hypothetical protein
MSFRKFSTYSKIQGSQILLSDHLLPKIRLPLPGSKTVDLTLSHGQTIQEFEAKVKDASGQQIHTFKVFR